MKKNEQLPDWFLLVLDKAPLLFVGGGILTLVLVIFTAMYFNQRLDNLSKRNSNLPARKYEGPNLDDYAVKAVDVDKLPLKQTVYVPAYSHIYHDGGRPCLMESTLSIRNTDTHRSLYITQADYFDSHGKKVRGFLDSPIRLKPLQTIEFLVERHDTSGGAGANFLVQWRGKDETSKPLVECVMVGSVGSQGFAFERNGFDLQSADD